MKQVVRDWTLAVIAAATVGLLFVFGWSYAIHVMYPVITYGPNTGEFLPAIARPGEVVYLCRDMRFNRAAELAINRSMTSGTHERTETIDMGGIWVSRQPGEMHQCRLIKLPDIITKGDWVLHTYITHTDWPFWKSTHASPTVSIRIIDNDRL